MERHKRGLGLLGSVFEDSGGAVSCSIGCLGSSKVRCFVLARESRDFTIDLACCIQYMLKRSAKQSIVERYQNNAQQRHR